MSADASHTFEEHVGEARLRLHARSLPALFEEAARALAELMGGDGRSPDAAPVTVDVRAPDREALLASWIDELVFLSETHKRIWTEVRVEHVTSSELRATVRGVEAEALRTQVKAATLHDLRIVEDAAGGFDASVVLDV